MIRPQLLAMGALLVTLVSCSKPQQTEVSAADFKVMQDRVEKLEAKQSISNTKSVDLAVAAPQALLSVSANQQLGGSYQRPYGTMAACIEAKTILLDADQLRIDQMTADEQAAEEQSGVRAVYRSPPARISVVCLPS